VTRGIDFGFTNPFACLWLCRDGDRVLVLREYHQPRRTIEEHARAIRAIDEELRSQGLRIGQAFADPSGRLERETLARGGVVCAAASGQVRGGIDLVRNALAVRDGRPGLVIDPRCANLIREFELYRWAE